MKSPKRFIASALAVVLSWTCAASPALAATSQSPMLSASATGDYAFLEGSSDFHGNEDALASQKELNEVSLLANSAGGSYEWTRLGGNDRYDTMLMISQESFADNSCQWAVIATGDTFPDALVASSVAGTMHCPILLTAPWWLSAQTRIEIERLGVTHAFIMGGESAIGAGTEQEIRNLGVTTHRVSGTSRVGTSIAGLNAIRGSGSTSNTVIVASGANFPDAVSVSPWTYNTKSPIILTNNEGTLTAAAVEAIQNDSHIKYVVMVGGTAVVKEDVRSQLGSKFTYVRVGGANRYETSKLIAEWETEDLGFNWSTPAITTGTNFPDALTGSALSGKNRSVTLLANSMSDPTISLLASNQSSVDHGYTLGSYNAISIDDPFNSSVFRNTLTGDRLNGVDISGWDRGININDLDADFVIIKATEGLQGTVYNPWYKTWADQAIANGKLVGFYHYANGEDPIEEADEFYESIKDYKGRAIACLDWEGIGNDTFETGEDVQWCKAFLDRLQSRFGGTPFLYMSKSVCNKYDWSSVASKYPLWGAQYPDYEDIFGYQSDPWQSSSKWGAWGTYPAIFQYTSSGVLEHNGGIGHFDFNLFYGNKSDWQSYL